MYEVKAIASFDHHGGRSAGDTFKVGSKRQADELEKKGLVEIVGAAEVDSGAEDETAPAPTKRAAKKAAKSETKAG